MKRFAILALLSVLVTGIPVPAEESREEKEKRLADAMAEMLDLLDSNPMELSEEDAEKRDARAQELEKILGTLSEELGGKDRKEQEALAEQILRKHRPDAAAKLDARKESAKDSICRSQLKQLAVLFALFESKKRAHPKSIADLGEAGLVDDAAILKCPVHGGAYVYDVPSDGDMSPEDEILFYCPKAHASGERIVCRVSGSVHGVKEAIFLLALKGGRLEPFEPKVSDLTATVGKQEGKLWVTIRGTVENLADPKVTGLASAQALVRVSVSRKADGLFLDSPRKTFVAAAGARTVAFEIQMEIKPGEGGLFGSVEIEDAGSGLHVQTGLKISNEPGK